MCSTYSTSRVGFVSHDHYLRTVVKQRKSLARATLEALPSPTVEKLSTEYRTPGKTNPNPPYSVPFEISVLSIRHVESTRPLHSVPPKLRG